MKYIIPAILTALASILAARITANATVTAAGGRINKIEAKATTLEDLSRLPVGTILSSMLSPKEFAAAVGDPADYNQEKSRWTLADDKGKMPGTKWAELTENRPIPDLRGQFLRGLNLGRKDEFSDPDGDKRKSGDTQKDTVGPHSHEAYVFRNNGPRSNSRPLALDDKDETGWSPNVIKPSSGVETRPRNVAVYYYIRVN